MEHAWDVHYLHMQDEHILPNFYSVMLLRMRVKATWQKVLQEPEWVSEDKIFTNPRSTVAWGLVNVLPQAVCKEGWQLKGVI